jgi:hypothetical protein
VTPGDMADLSGAWRGIFNYPRLLPPGQFEAELRDHVGMISGLTREPHYDGSGTLLHATIEGRREGASVNFRKTYDDFDDDYRTVRYEGQVDFAGDEIIGQWTVPGAWSGTFLMIRTRAAAEPARQKDEARL